MAGLQLREKEIFETLKHIQKLNFAVVGGYAVNAYTLPRFSVDCDIVVLDDEDSGKIEKELMKFGYKKRKNEAETSYAGSFKRYEKEIAKDFSVSMDILIKEVLDRQTHSTFSAEWILKNSKTRSLKGKTISEELKLRIINPDALFVMKIITCRLSDIRDIFLLVSSIKDENWIREEVSKRYSFKDRFERVKREITSKQFKDGLQGIFGFVDSKIFEKHQKMIFELAGNG
ncbi:MAG: hypothetical protein V1886_04495 [archaeon]